MAVKKLTIQELLADVAQNGKYCIAAVEKLTDREVLADLAKKHPVERVRYAAEVRISSLFE